MPKLFIIVFAAWGVLLSACGATDSATPSSTPLSDADQARIVYDKVSDAIKDQDENAFRQVLCPQRQEDIDIDAWFKASKVPAYQRFQLIKDPTGDNVESEGAEWGVTAWGNVMLDSGGGGLQLAQINGEWFLCEN